MILFRVGYFPLVPGAIYLSIELHYIKWQLELSPIPTATIYRYFVTALMMKLLRKQL